MNALVTGSGGFIGRHLTARLKDEGFNVTPLPREMLFQTKLLPVFIRKHKPDYIFHLAAYGNHFNQRDASMVIYTNIVGTFNLMASASITPYYLLFNFSSSSVELPYQTFYAASKAAGEKLGMAFNSVYKKPIISIRPHTVIGVGDAATHLLPTLIRAAHTGERIPFDPKPHHDYIAVDDLCEALLTIMQAPPDEDFFPIIPIGSGKSHSNQEVKEIVEYVTGRDIKVEETQGLRPYDSTNWVADTSIMRHFGFLPKRNLKSVISEMNQAYGK